MPKKTKKQKLRAEAHQKLEASPMIFSYKSNSGAPNPKQITSIRPAVFLLRDIRRSAIIGLVFISIEIALAFMSK